MELVRIGLSVRLQVPVEALERHMPLSPAMIGQALAEQVDGHVRSARLGYYPALEYFREGDAVEADLLDAADAAAWLGTHLVRNEIQVKLRPVFATVRFETLQTQAFMLPAVRPAERDALAKLARHYTPDTVRTDLLVGMMQRQGPAPGLERLARLMLRRWLGGSFAALEILSARTR